MKVMNAMQISPFCMGQMPYVQAAAGIQITADIRAPLSGRSCDWACTPEEGRCSRPRRSKVSRNVQEVQGLERQAWE
jgi:hypothetical protein